VAGNFERDATVALLERYYGSVAPGTLPSHQLRPPDQLERTETVVRRGGGERVCALAFEAPGYDSPAYHAFLVGASLLDARGTGILPRAVQDLEPAERPDLTVQWDRGAHFGRLIIRCDLPEGFAADRCYRLVQEAVAAALEFGITEDDVAGVVAGEELETLLQREQLRMTGIMTAEMLTLGGRDFFAAYLPRLREVTPDEVARSLDTYIVDAPCLAVLVEPGPAGLRATGSADLGAGPQMPAGMNMPPAMAEALRGVGVAAGAQDSTLAAAETPVVAPSPPPTVRRSVLRNGAVLVTQTDSVSPIMAIHLTVRGRALLDRDYGEPGALTLVHRLLTAGVAGCDESCLARRLRGLGARIKLVDDPRIPMDDYYTSGRFSFVRVEVLADRGLELLELLAEMTQRASFTSIEFERERTEQIELLAQQQESARELSRQLLRAALYDDHPLVLPPQGTVSSLQELTYDEVKAVYRKAFAPENLIFAIVSPLDHEELAARLEELLPGRGEPTAGLPSLPATAAAERIEQHIGGEMAAIRLGSVFDIDPADETALTLLVAVLSDRLQMDLRETRGLSYSVGASIDVHGPFAELVAWINPPVERAEEGERALRTSLGDFDPASVTSEEFEQVRAARKGRAMMRRLSSMGRAYYLAMAELDGDVGRYLESLSSYDRVAPADLRRVHDRYLAGRPLVTVVVD
jgi:zinc protease